MEHRKELFTAQHSVLKIAIIMMATMTTLTIRAQTPSSQNSVMKYITDTTYVTGKSPTNPVYHTAEDATIKALCDYILFIHQYDSVNLGLGISGNQYATPVFTGTKVIGSSYITDSTSLHKVTIGDTLYLPAVSNAVDQDSILVWGLRSHKVRKTPPPTSVSPPLTVTWPGDVFSLGTIPVTYGGTGITSYTTAGSIPYSTGAYSMAALPIGANGSVLAVVAGLLTWEPLTSISVTSVTATSGADINFSVNNGGTTPVITATLTTVNSAPGGYGSASVVPVFSVTGSGRVPTVTNTPIVIPYTSVTGLSPAYISTVTVNSSPGGYGCASCTVTETVTATGQVAAAATVPISINTSQINNLSTGGLWTTAGTNALTTTGVIATTTPYPITVHVYTNTVGDSFSVGGVHYILGGETSLIVANAQKSGSCFVAGTGEGGCYGGNVPFFGFSTLSGGGCATQYIMPSGPFGWSSWNWYGSAGSNTVPVSQIGSTTVGGNSLQYANGFGAFTSTVTGTSVTMGIAKGFTFQPTSGAANYAMISDQGTYSQTGTATGIAATFSNAQAIIGAGTNYRFLNATNSVGWGYYASSVTPTYLGAATTYIAPTTTTTTDSVVVMENGVIKKCNIINANTVQKSIVKPSGTSNYTISGAGQLIELPTPTGNYTLTLPAAATGMEITILNLNSSGTYQWSFATSVNNVSGSSFTTLANATSYHIIYDGTNWQQF